MRNLEGRIRQKMKIPLSNRPSKMTQRTHLHHLIEIEIMIEIHPLVEIQLLLEVSQVI